MARSEELVTEFRGIIDQVIGQRDAEEKRTRRYSVSFDRSVKVADLTFGAFKKHDGRPSVFGMGSEHLWGVHTERLTQEGSRRVGFLAVTSEIEHPDVLFRKWSFDSGMQMLEVDTQKTITDPEAIRAVIDWARSPHLNPNNLDSISILDSLEEKKVMAGLALMAKTRADLTRDLEQLDRARRAPMPNHLIY